MKAAAKVRARRSSAASVNSTRAAEVLQIRVLSNCVADTEAKCPISTPTASGKSRGYWHHRVLPEY
jgi:hypothetical protein